MNGPVTGFLAGVGDVWRAWHFLLARPRLWPWAAIPFVINTILFIAIGWGAWHFFSGWVNGHFFAGNHWWLEAFGWLVRILFWLLMGLLILFAFVPLASVVASPFNDILSDKVERIYAGAGVDEPFSWRLLARSFWLGLHGSLLLAAKTLGLMLLALPLYLIPVAGSFLGPAAQAAITIRYLALQHTAYSMDRRLYTYRQRQEFLRKFRGRTIGMGAMSFGIMMVPVLNALFLPVSAIAGTLLFCDTELKRTEK